MPITTYLPTKLSSEASRFRTNSGNIKFDYRSATGSAPYLFSIPFTSSRLNSLVDIMPPIVPTEDHITGDQTNYRRYVMDIALASDDYQRNVVLLHLDGELLEVTYTQSVYYEYVLEGKTVRELEHQYTLVEQPPTDVSYSVIQHLLLNSEEVEDGFVDVQKVVKLKRDTTLDFEYALFSVDVLGAKGILLTQTVTTDFGENKTVVSPTLIDDKVKNLKYFTGRNEQHVDNSFKTNVLYSSSFNKNGNVFTANNNTVLTDSNPNFYLYSKSIDADQDVIGYSFNVSPNRGSLLQLVNQSDNRNYIFNNTETSIGKSYSYFGTEYTGLLSSPFLLLNFDFTSQTDTFKLKIGDEPEVIVGDYTASTFKFLCARLSDLLYEKGILVIPCKNNRVAFDRFDGEESVELLLTSLYTKITTVPKFTSFEYLNSTKTVIYDPILHPVNFTFTYVDEIDPVVPSTYPLVYKLSITKDTGRDTDYSSYKVRLKFDIPSVRNTTQAFKLEVEEGVLDPTFTINDTDSVETILDAIAAKINTFLPSNYSVEVSYLTSAIDIVNNQATETTYIKVTTGTWMTIDPIYGGVYVENPDGSKTMIMKPNDGSSTITNDTGMLGFDVMYDVAHPFGIAALNPITGNFSQANFITSTMASSTQEGSNYCFILNEINIKFREYGYEAVPLFTSTTSGVHYYLGFTRIVNSPSQTKVVIGVPNLNDAYNRKFYISGKDLFRTSSQDGSRVKNTKDNASIDSWKDKVVPVTSGSTLKARAFEITDATASLYKTTFSGTIANRDNISIKSVGSYGTPYDVVLNPVSNPEYACARLIDIFLGNSNGWTPSTTISGTVYTVTKTGFATIVLDTADMSFTMSFSRTSPFYCCNSIGFDQPNDIVVNDYAAGWIKYPYGYNTSMSAYSALEVKPHIYMLISAYHSSIDGV